MALLVAVKISRAGVASVSDGVLPTASTGDTWANTGSEIVTIFNGSGGAMTVTKHIAATTDGAAAVDPTISIPDQGTVDIGPFPVGIYNDPSTGFAKITCAPVTSSKIKIKQQVINQ